MVSGGKWRLAPHLALLNRKLVDLAAGRITRLLVLMPPRHGKSELCSKYFTSWYLGTFPERSVILASYEANFAAKWGRDTRAVLDQWGPLSLIHISEPTRLLSISYAVFCLKKKNQQLQPH